MQLSAQALLKPFSAAKDPRDADDAANDNDKATETPGSINSNEDEDEASSEAEDGSGAEDKDEDEDKEEEDPLKELDDEVREQLLQDTAAVHTTLNKVHKFSS